MSYKNNGHSFHIPVMGIGYTIDTPVKVAQFGISSVLSLVDDGLIEKMREFYCRKFNFNYEPIIKNNRDARAQRITSYLNLLDIIVKQKIEEIKASISKKSDELSKYFTMLPDFSELKKEFQEKFKDRNRLQELKDWLNHNITAGSIDVNIMTKMDRENYENGEKIPEDYNDGRQAIRGFAESNLESSVILSSGMNPKLYGYMENFKDFYPDETGFIKKKIVLKVSDYRSAQIQGKFLAKKGLWVSEYRVESGLNCGGHAFATAGYLLGPILEEFKKSKEELKNSTFEILKKGLAEKKFVCPDMVPELKITAQGGVGTNDEHNFLLDYYEVDSVGWGTPFLLVDDIVAIDDETKQLLANATEDDLYVSNISPLGVLFNNLRGNTKDQQRDKFIEQGTPGSICTQKYAAGNKDYTEESICIASRKYQKIKIDELKAKNLTTEEFNDEFNKITEKSCICVGLGTSALIKNDIKNNRGSGVSVCPGPNMAYFSELVSLEKMIDHIYGRTNLIKRTDRPNMYIKELSLYFENLKDRITNAKFPMHPLELKYINDFQINLKDGIEYYKEFFKNHGFKFAKNEGDMQQVLKKFEIELEEISFTWKKVNEEKLVAIV
jgi:hypothetical protein